jgi:hypothetical chaperone protein
MIGFDFGTSNCAVAVMDNNKPCMVNLGEHGKYMSSTLYAPSRDIISSWLASKLPSNQQSSYKQSRTSSLRKGASALRELIYDGISTDLSFGQQALAQYLEEPEEGFYVKSPKSFLGASGISAQQIEFFEDIVAAMMIHVKQLIEQQLQREVNHAVIGRPINFQGLNGEESNQQAVNILTNAAKLAGFKQIEFQFEPVAAGFEFESTLTEEQKVLVVDIGGGTSDCSMLLMGPEFAKKDDRNAQLLSHCGERIGGNDFDIQLAINAIMPLLGMNSLLNSGKPMPTNSFRQAVTINSITAQSDFYSPQHGRYLQQLVKDSASPEQVAMLLKVYQHKLSYHLVNDAEQSKIALSEQLTHQLALDYLANDLTTEVSRSQFNQANQREFSRIADLMHNSITLAGTTPDVVFVTGGTAKSPMISEFIQQQLPSSKLVVGDHFGSVTSGLCRWANHLFK